MDGIYVIRTSLETSARGAGEALDAYKSLSQVERAFRFPKTTQLALCAVYVYSEDRVRGHVFLCLLPEKDLGNSSRRRRASLTLATSSVGEKGLTMLSAAPIYRALATISSRA